jgi:23S rRNA (uracil1939-C5)-methyltransferase
VLEEELAGVRLQVGPGDFFQTNPGVADRIARDLVELLAPFRDRPVLDLYCGVGGFTLALAQSHGWAYGAEVVEGAIARARENARLNHLPAEFGVGRVAEIVPELARRTAGQGPVVVVDPARRGLEEGVIESVLSLQPAAVAYLSCNPRALARDLALFTARGWSLSHIAAYDMFPQTAHLETLVMLLPPSPPEVTRRAPRRRVVR